MSPDVFSLSLKTFKGVFASRGKKRSVIRGKECNTISEHCESVSISMVRRWAGQENSRNLQAGGRFLRKCSMIHRKNRPLRGGHFRVDRSSCSKFHGSPISNSPPKVEIPGTGRLQGISCLLRKLVGIKCTKKSIPHRIVQMPRFWINFHFVNPPEMCKFGDTKKPFLDFLKPNY